MAYPPVWIFKPTLENYRNVFVENDFGTFAINSTIVAALTTFFGLLFGIPGAYAVARYKRTGFALIVLAARMAPGIAFLLPWFVLFVQLKLTNTYFALVTTHLIFTLPLVLWMMIGFIEAIPREIEQAAMVDGCTVWGSLFRVVIPLTVPGIAASGILCFIFSWNNFLFSVVLAGESTKTLPVAVFNFIGLSIHQLGAAERCGFDHHPAGSNSGVDGAEIYRSGSGCRRYFGVRGSERR